MHSTSIQIVYPCCPCDMVVQLKLSTSRSTGAFPHHGKIGLAQYWAWTYRIIDKTYDLHTALLSVSCSADVPNLVAYFSSLLYTAFDIVATIFVKTPVLGCR
jgi:hypothetical protein